MKLIEAIIWEDMGTVIELLSSRRDTGADATAWLKMVGQQLISAEDKGDYWRIVAKKIKQVRVSEGENIKKKAQGNILRAHD